MKPQIQQTNLRALVKELANLDHDDPRLQVHLSLALMAIIKRLDSINDRLVAHDI
ncbi:MAG: hypothetical protein ACR2QA_09300 [Solirubrobacteraceae bacterium]